MLGQGNSGSAAVGQYPIGTLTARDVDETEKNKIVGSREMLKQGC